MVDQPPSPARPPRRHRGSTRLNLLGQLLLAMLLTGLVPLLILSYSQLDGYRAASQQATAAAADALDHEALIALQARADQTAQALSRLLQGAAEDTLTVAQLPRTPTAYLAFAQAHTREIWYPAGTAAQPTSVRQQLLLYEEIVYIDAAGNEALRILDGAVVPQALARNVADPANTTYRTETYFADTRRLPRNGIYMSQLTGWHTSVPAQPASQIPPAQKGLLGADYARYLAVIRVATPVFDAAGHFDGIVMLALDHRHLLEQVLHIDPVSDTLSILYPRPSTEDYAYMFDDEGYTLANPNLYKIRGLDGQGRLISYTTPGMSDKEKKKHPSNAKYDPNEPVKREIYAAVMAGQSGVRTTTNQDTGRQRVTAYVPVLGPRSASRPAGIFGGLAIGANEADFHSAAAAVTATIESERDRQQLRLLVLAVLGILGIGLAALLLARRITWPLLRLTAAARAMDQGTLDTHTLDQVRRRRTAAEVNTLTEVFTQMAERVQLRERRLKAEIAELHIQIDEHDARRQVAEVTDTDYFRALQANAGTLRARFKTRAGRPEANHGAPPEDVRQPPTLAAPV